MSTVTFRRIGGRIVPIRISTDQQIRSHNKKALGYGAGAVAVGVGTGSITSRMMHQSAHLENQARTTVKMYRGIQKNIKGDWSSPTVKRMGTLGEKAIGLATASKKLEKKAFAVRKWGTAVSALLATEAVIHLYKANKKKQQAQKTALSEGEVEALLGGSAVAATFAVRSSYLRGVGHRGVSILKGAFKRAIMRR